MGRWRSWCVALPPLIAIICGVADPSDGAEALIHAKVLAPHGTLRAAINLGNPVLASRNPEGEPVGISVDIARELARRLDMPISLHVFDQAGQVSDAAGADVWDVAFLAIDPKRAETIAFTSPYVLIEGVYAVPSGSPLQGIGEVDRPGIRVSVVAKSAYDLYLSRTLKHATLVRSATGDAAFARFLTDGLDVVAGVRQAVLSWAAAQPQVRLLPERFMAIEQAMGVPRAHAEATPDLARFVESLKADGFIAAALVRHVQSEARVAPAAQ